MRVTAVLLLVAAAAAPVLGAEPPAARRLGEAKPLVLEDGREVYGARPVLREATPLAAVVGQPERFANRRLRVQGTVGAVCQKRGCWLTLREGDAQLQVRFRDYAFFVPLDVAGRRAVVEGTAKVEVTSEATRRHFAEDAGRSPAEIADIRGDERTVLVIADAVEIGAPVR